MSEVGPKPAPTGPPPSGPAPSDAGDQLVGFGVELARAVEAAIDRGEWLDVATAVTALHAADQADLLEALGGDHRTELLTRLRDSIDPETLTHLDDAIREKVHATLGDAGVAAAITELDLDDAVDVIEDMDEDDRAAILARLSPSDRALLEEALTFPEDSAGRLMQRELVTVPESWHVGDTIDYMRGRAAMLPRDFYDIFVVDDARRPVGIIPLSRLMRNRRPVRISDILHRDMKLIPVDMDQEDVGLLFRQYGLVSAPVIDAAGRLVGVITVDDVVNVIHVEAEEDIMRLGGVTARDFYAAVLDTARARFSWLLVNLATAIVASIVISLFEAAIDKVVALAVLMPIVASMGGNAGTQTLTVAVRALSLKELTAANALRIVVKETVIGGINGIIFAGLIGIVAWFWFGDVTIGAIMSAATIINLVVAGFAGVTIPIVLDRLRIDPAIASTVLLTTITDVVGFLSFLGLASLILL